MSQAPRPYPNLVNATPDNIADWCRQVTRSRSDDIVQILGPLSSTYVAGRSVKKIPTSSTDVVATDRVGDVNITPTAIYYLVNNAGTPEWVKTTLVTF